MTELSGAGVYVLHATEMAPWRIKIGVTTDLRKRVMTLRSESPMELSVLMFQPGGTRGFEQKLHRKFHAQRLHGEWFQMNDEAMSELGRYIGGAPCYVTKSKEPSKYKRTIGKCSNCNKNVQSHDEYKSKADPMRRGKTLYWHKDCSRLVRNRTLQL